MSCHSLLWGIFLTQGSHPGFLHCRQILYSLSHEGSPKVKVVLVGNQTQVSCLEGSCVHHYTTNAWTLSVQFSSVAQSCLTLCDPHGLQHTRLRCPSPTPRACSNSCPLSWWCHPTISSSVSPFSSCLQSFPASGSFPMSQFFASGGQSIGVSASASVLPNEYSGQTSFRMDWLDLLAVQGTLKSFLQHHSSKASILWCSAFFIVQFSHPYMTTGKTIALTRRTFVGKVMSLLFNMLSRLVIAFVPKSKHLLISGQQSLSAVILEPQKIKSLTVSIIFPSICHKVMELDAMIFVFWMLSFKPTFSLSSSLWSRGSLVLFHFLP